MSLFKRNREDADVPAPAEAGPDAPGQPDPADGSHAAEPAAGYDRSSTGPYDVTEVPDAAGRVDLGSLWLPGRQGMELRLEVEDKSKRVIAATVSLGGSSMQVQAFAAPRVEGVWDDIRTEIAAAVTRQGGTAEEVTGPFGRELITRIPVRTPDGRSAHQPSRFVGVDGPRWFVRAVLNGPAASDPERAADLEQVLRGVVVVRGAEAMAPRELLALSLPAVPSSPAAGQDPAPARDQPAPGGQTGEPPAEASPPAT